MVGLDRYLPGHLFLKETLKAFNIFLTGPGVSETCLAGFKERPAERRHALPQANPCVHLPCWSQ